MFRQISGLKWALEAFKLIVGLGNPTKNYENTRHNAGFWLVDELASRYSLSFSHNAGLYGNVAGMDVAGEKIHLLKPTTFMNNSGRAVGTLLRYFKIPPQRLLVAHDELDLDAGIIKFKKGGGHGGHNGLRDIISNLGCSNFCRLRVGIGRPDERCRVTPYVLSKPSVADEKKITAQISKTVELIPRLIEGDDQGFMNSLHGAS